LHHIGYGVLSDMGAVYTLGDSPGTVIRGNLIHDVFSYSYGGWGLYTDEGSTDILWENNVVYNTKSGGIHQHYGKNNIFRHNIIAFSKSGQIIRTRIEEHSSFTLQENVIVFDNANPYGGNMHGAHYAAHDNIYWDVTGAPFTFLGKSLEDLQHDGLEVNSRIVDPGFVNAAAFDFRLKPNAPAEPLVKDAVAAMAIAGLEGDPEWTSKPKRILFKELSKDMQPN
jgi:hypothetical protein